MHHSLNGCRATAARAQAPLGALLVSCLGMLTPPQVAFAQAATAPVSRRIDFRIPSGDLASALRQFADTSGLQLVYSTQTTAKVRTSGVSGTMTEEEALRLLLVDTGLTYRFAGEKTVTIEKSASSAPRTLGPVRVEGATSQVLPNGINGSRDVTATEGTGSFTTGAMTIGSKAPRSIKDTPQSVSVITSEQIEQQNIDDFTTAMKQLPGVSFAQGTTSVENLFYARGFEVSSIQVDGGAPLSTAVGDRQAFFPQIDLSIYDHVELLRGAAGQFNGYGDPSGTVNLVRKKPVDHRQISIDAASGSWDHYRMVLDAASPLAFEGALRGRMVVTWQSNKHFYDVAKDDKRLLYGVLEYDLMPTTLLTAGGSRTDQDSVPWVGGLPRYQTGGDLGLPRDTCLCFAWNRWDFGTTEIFGGVEQGLGEDWTLKLNLTRNRQSSTRKTGASLGAVNPTNGRGPQLGGGYTEYSSDQLSTEAVLTGGFSLFGQRQEVTIGANRVDSDGGGRTVYSNLIAGTAAAPYQPYLGGPQFYSGSPNGALPPIDVFDLDPYDILYTEPRNPLPATRYPTYGTIQSVAYLNMRLTAFDRLHLSTGLRWSRFESDLSRVLICTGTTSSSCRDKQIGDTYEPFSEVYSDNDVSWPPSVSLSYDITSGLSAYLGYADIYQSQANRLDAERKPLEPITGANWEGGLKWSARNGQLNLSLAAYRIEKDGFGMLSGVEQPISPGVTCCYLVDRDSTHLSQGVDLEAAGEVARGWQLSVSYTYNDNEFHGGSYGAREGLPLVTIAPHHLYKLWTSYDFGAAGQGGWLGKLTVSGGVNGQSDGYRSGIVCVNLDETVTPDPITGSQRCLSNAPPDRVAYSFTVEPYAVFSGRLDYRLNERWSAALNLENIADKSYYQTTGSNPQNGNWYGAPRSYTLSVRAKL